MMEDDDQRRRAGQVVGSLLDKQSQLGNPEDPFDMMKQLAETFKQPTGPLSNTGWAPGGYKPPSTTSGTAKSGMNLTSFAAFQKQVISQCEFAGTLHNQMAERLSSGGGATSARRHEGRSGSLNQDTSPLAARFRDKKALVGGLLPEWKVGGVLMTGATLNPNTTDISSIVKNKDIFEKAQQRGDKTGQNWADKLQESKEAMLSAQKGKLPNLPLDVVSDPVGAFDKMISAKKDEKQQQITAKKNHFSGHVKLSKDQEIQIGLDMIPMFQAKEEELQQQHTKLKGLRQEIDGYMEEHGIKIRYAQPQKTTNFMNRKITMPKKSITSGTSQTDLINTPGQKMATQRDVTTTSINADLEFEKLQNSAILTGKVSDQKQPSRVNREDIIVKQRKPAHYENKYREFEQRVTIDGGPVSLDPHLNSSAIISNNDEQDSCDSIDASQNEEDDQHQQSRTKSPPKRQQHLSSRQAYGGYGGSVNKPNNGLSSTGRQYSELQGTTAQSNTVQQSANKWTSSCLKPLKGNSTTSHRSSTKRSHNASQDRSRTRSQSTNLKNVVEPIKSGSMNLRSVQKNGAVRASEITVGGKDSGIQEERGESTCSSKKHPKHVYSDGFNSSLYPHLNDKNELLSETRNSCAVLENMGTQKGRLEGAEELKMPPVSSAVAHRRSRKNSQHDFGCSNSQIQQAKFKSQAPNSSHINESQKRIRAIINKNVNDKSIKSGGSCELDALGSFSVKQPPVTSRDLKSLDQMTSLNKSQQETNNPRTTQNNKIALDVTDRLYNKKKIQKMRNKTSSQAQQQQKNNGNSGAKSKSKHNRSSYIEEKMVTSPKNQTFTGAEYLLGNKLTKEGIKTQERYSVGCDKTTINSNGGSQSQNPSKPQKRQQISHNNASFTLAKVASQTTQNQFLQKDMATANNTAVGCNSQGPITTSHHHHTNNHQTNNHQKTSSSNRASRKLTKSKDKSLSQQFKEQQQYNTTTGTVFASQQSSQVALPNHQTTSLPQQQQTNFADKIAKLKEIKASYQTEPFGGDGTSNQLAPGALSFRVVNSKQIENTDKDQASPTNKEKFKAVKRALEIREANLTANPEKQALANKRSSSVTSQKKMYNSFHKEISRSNLLAQQKDLNSRNANVSNTTGVATIKDGGQRRSRLQSQKRLTTDYDINSTSVQRSKNMSSRRDLKELIFVDQKAFAENIDYLSHFKEQTHANTALQSASITISNPNHTSGNAKQQPSTTKGKSLLVFSNPNKKDERGGHSKASRGANNSSAMERQSNKSRQSRLRAGVAGKQSPLNNYQRQKSPPKVSSKNQINKPQQQNIILQQVVETRAPIEVSRNVNTGTNSDMNVQEFNIQSTEWITQENNTHNSVNQSQQVQSYQNPNDVMMKVEEQTELQLQPGQKKKTFTRKETLKEVRRSISRARVEHRKNLDAISKINDSVKYSPQKQHTLIVGRDALNQKSVDTCADGDDNHLISSGLNREIELGSTQKKNIKTIDSRGGSNTKHNGVTGGSVSQSMALQFQADVFCKDSNPGSRKLSRVQSNEREIGSNKIDMLQHNLAKLEKLERRLMRGRGQRKKSTRVQDFEAIEQLKAKEATMLKSGKTKKKGKQWRFAYDLYCKELINSNQAQLTSNRSTDKGAQNSANNGLATNEITQQQQQQSTKNNIKANYNAATYSNRRNTPSNSMSHREHILKQIAANKDPAGKVYLGSANSSMAGKEMLNKMPTNSSRVSSQQNSSMRRMIQTATEQFNQRTKVRNSHLQRSSRLSTANAAQESQRQSPDVFDENSPIAVNNQRIQVMDQKAIAKQPLTIASPSRNDMDQNVKTGSFVEYPVPPSQPMLSDRSQQATNACRQQKPTASLHSPQIKHGGTHGSMPQSLQQSPERDEIICFAALQSSPQEKILSSPRENILKHQKRMQMTTTLQVKTSTKQQPQTGVMTLDSVFTEGSISLQKQEQLNKNVQQLPSLQQYDSKLENNKAHQAPDGSRTANVKSRADKLSSQKMSSQLTAKATLNKHNSTNEANASLNPVASVKLGKRFASRQNVTESVEGQTEMTQARKAGMSLDSSI